MKTLMNKARFIKAVEYVNKNFFSQPYSIGPMVDRWFNQLSMIELTDGRIVHLTAEVAQAHVDIVVDGKVVSKEDVSLVIQFHGKDSEQERNRSLLAKQVKALEDDIQRANEANDSPKVKSKRARLIEELRISNKKLELLDAAKLKAGALYQSIVARGRSTLNVKHFEQTHQAKIKNIVHRPNHGLTHSVRAAYSITTLLAFREKYNKGFPLKELEIEKLQFMMLFSVVGRGDETGFNDGAAGQKTYEGFRTNSAREYLKYNREHSISLYPPPNSLEKLYRDALVVELMGYSSIEDVVKRRRNPPELLIDYVIDKESTRVKSIGREQALILIANGTYSLDKFFGPVAIRKESNALLSMMNEAHALDLTRCYPLFPNTVGGPRIINNFNFFFNQIDFLAFADAPDEDKLTSLFQLMRWNFDALERTGQKSTFGMLSVADFLANKDSILKEIRAIALDCTDPARRAALLKAARAAHDAVETVNYFTSNDAHSTEPGAEERLLTQYRNHLIIHFIAEQLQKGKVLASAPRMFRFNQQKNGEMQDHANAASLVNALTGITPFPGVVSIDLPLVSTVVHNADTVMLTFDEQLHAERFQEVYKEMFPTAAPPEITLKGAGKWGIETDRTNYKQLVKDQLLEFKLVTIPEKVDREDQLIDAEGDIEALKLIQQSRGLVRLVSTSDLDGSKHPDYEYMLDALDDPIHERYAAPIKEKGSWKADRTQYQDPRDGEHHTRQLTDTVDLRYQEPVTTPRSFDEKIKDGLTVNEERGKAKNTIFTKKMAHSLIPYHGKTIAFPGYLSKQHNYFPIGILSDLEQVNTKDGRYIWSTNVVSHTKFWIRDTSDIDLLILKNLSAKVDADGLLERDKVGKPIQQVQDEESRNVLPPDSLKNYKGKVNDRSIAHYKSRVERRFAEIIKFLDNKNYNPTEQFLKDCEYLVLREQVLFKIHCPKDAQNPEFIDQFGNLLKRIKKQIEEKSNKAISISELVRQQKLTTEASGHNEVLASVTKSAVRGLYAAEDKRFHRLNLAFHALRIKKEYGYDVPLLVMSSDKPPYHYTETMIKADLLAVYTQIRAGKMSDLFDKTEFPVYKLDENNDVVVGPDGQGVVLPGQVNVKNLEFQKGLLFDLFKIGIPGLTRLDDLAGDIIGTQAIDPRAIGAVISDIATQMNVIGSLQREEQRMNKIFATDSRQLLLSAAAHSATFSNPFSRGVVYLNTIFAIRDIRKKEEFFLRTVSLGHEALIKIMLAKKDFPLTTSLLNEAIKRAAKSNNLELKSLFIEIHAIKVKLDNLKPGKENLVEIIAEIEHIQEEIGVLATKLDVSQLNRQINEKRVEIFLNTASRNEENQAHLPEFISFLKDNPKFITFYTYVLNTNQSVQLNELINTIHELGVEGAIQQISLELFHKDPKVIQFLDKRLIIELIEKDKLRGTNLENACKAFSLDDDVIVTAYKKTPSVLKFVDSSRVIAQMGSPTNQIDPDDACRAFRNNAHVALTAYKIKPISIQYAALSLIETLVKQGKISVKHANEAFPGKPKYEQARESLHDLVQEEIRNNRGYIYNNFNYKQAELLNSLNQLIKDSKEMPTADQQTFLTKARQTLDCLYQSNLYQYQEVIIDDINIKVERLAELFTELTIVRDSSNSGEILITEQTKLQIKLKDIKKWFEAIVDDDEDLPRSIVEDINKLLAGGSGLIELKVIATRIIDTVSRSTGAQENYLELKENMNEVVSTITKILSYHAIQGQQDSQFITGSQLKLEIQQMKQDQADLNRYLPK